jgi:arsenate reductase-like glutaredoxin family protein
MQVDNDKNSDKEKQLPNQRDTIKKVIDWLREEGLEPQEITHLRKDASIME